MNEERTHIKPNEEDSQKLAMVIECMKAYFPMLDIEYAKLMAKELNEQAGRQDSMAVLAANYDPTRTKLLRTQALSLNCLINFIETMVDCNKLKEQITKNDDHFKEISKLFI